MDFATQLFEAHKRKLCQNSGPITVSVAAPSKPQGSSNSLKVENRENEISETENVETEKKCTKGS